ncbi:ADP-ribose diphosphatase [Shewanella glacialipiscicola]|uniref:ADP-ribose diphosphatase n=1 Tax=Shewanella glacialipiscicola TaxID=614069 RepID=UPI0021D9CFB0|nr:ADP-ribose diphosphatase [Shewanella glacialipiscicola]MCU7995531.1 ADP-ribose diphosphatase [Shewanella glacialipiscicola]MCU8026778.1 ADP-ribose diphosphatase [Shewanella glacialipiscicola]
MNPAIFSQKDIEIIGKKSLYQGFFSLDEYTFKHKLFAGGWSQPVTREVFERGHAVVVLPYDIKQDKIVLIEQVRFPALATTKSPWLMELVAGMIALEETAVDVAHRELFEETGLVANSMHFINSYLASPGGSTERFYFYWADIDSNDARGLHGLAEEHEDIRLHVMSREQAYNSMLGGEIDNASTVIGLQWLQLNYQQLR